MENLPGNGREAGDPCADDEQCRTGLKCLCQAHGGKECVAQCVVQDVVIPPDGEYHNVHCSMSCQCTETGELGCVDMCPPVAIDCVAGQHPVMVPPPEGQCCGTPSCEPDSEPMCCDPSQEPGQNGNPICKEGHACCPTNGQWVCSIGDGHTFPCVGAPQGPFGQPCASCDGAGQFCGGIAALQCTDFTYCVDDPNDNCDPHHGGADCGGVCRCAPKLDQTTWTAVASGAWQSDPNNLAQGKGNWNSGNWPEGWITLSPSTPTFVRYVRLEIDQLPSPATTTHVFSISTTNTPTLTPIQTIHGETAVHQWLRVEVNQEITAFQAKTTESPSWVAWFNVEFYG